MKRDYGNRTIDILIPGYIKELKQKYNHINKNKTQHTPYQPAPRKYGKSAQDPIGYDTNAWLYSYGILCV